MYQISSTVRYSENHLACMHAPHWAACSFRRQLPRARQETLRVPTESWAQPIDPDPDDGRDIHSLSARLPLARSSADLPCAVARRGGYARGGRGTLEHHERPRLQAPDAHLEASVELAAASSRHLLPWLRDVVHVQPRVGSCGRAPHLGRLRLRRPRLHGPRKLRGPQEPAGERRVCRGLQPRTSGF